MACNECAKISSVEERNVSSTRVVTIDGGFKENWSVDFSISDGSCGPVPRPTLSAVDVSVAGQCYDVSKIPRK
jgi:hypothetical protein